MNGKFIVHNTNTLYIYTKIHILMHIKKHTHDIETQLRTCRRKKTTTCLLQKHTHTHVSYHNNVITHDTQPNCIRKETPTHMIETKTHCIKKEHTYTQPQKEKQACIRNIASLHTTKRPCI